MAQIPGGQAVNALGARWQRAPRRGPSSHSSCSHSCYCRGSVYALYWHSPI